MVWQTFQSLLKENTLGSLFSTEGCTTQGLQWRDWRDIIQCRIKKFTM